MGNCFSIMDQHVDRAHQGQVASAGKLVLSRLPAGHGIVPAIAPTLKLILDGEVRYAFDGRSVVVRAGQYLYLDAGTACVVDNRSATLGLCIGVPSLPRGPGGDRRAEGRQALDPARALPAARAGAGLPARP